MKDTVLSMDLMDFPTEYEAGPNVFLQNEQTNRIKIAVFKDGVPYALTGRIIATFMKPDNTSFEISYTNGSINGNVSSLSLPSDCYSQNGRIHITVRNITSEAKTTLAVIHGTMYSSRI